jgi:3-oxoadipate enol-lactonase
MPIAKLKSVRLHYELSGDAALPIVVFSNSLGSNLAMWDGQVEAVAGRFRVLRYDTRGHGGSSVPEGPYCVEQLAGDLLELVDSLGIDEFHLCGLSLGGATGQWIGLHAPERLKKLVLANTSAKFGTLEMWNTRIESVGRDGIESVIPGTVERWFTAGFRAAQPEVVERTTAMLRKNDLQGYLAGCAAVRDVDFRESVGQITTPTLVITGTYDPVTPPADARFLAEKIAGARYLELDAAHLSNVERVGEFNEALSGFLSD